MTETPYQKVPINLQGRTVELEVRWTSQDRKDGPLIIFLHEGLGSISMWEDWPDRLCSAVGARGLVYSRYGYGGSTPRPPGADWPLDYLEREADEALPALLTVLGIDVIKDKPILFGHSDGGTIALLHAAAFPDSAAAIITVAPHVNVEEIGMTRIAYLQQNYFNGMLRNRLALFHRNPDSVFWGWSKLWRSSAFRHWNINSLLPRILCPVLAVQGAQDQYGTLEQIYQIKRQVPQARLHVIDKCRHIPHQEQPQVLLDVVADFIRSLSPHGLPVEETHKGR